MCLPELAFFVWVLVVLAGLRAVISVIKSGKTYDDDTTQKFKRILEQGEKL